MLYLDSTLIDVRPPISCAGYHPWDQNTAEHDSREQKCHLARWLDLQRTRKSSLNECVGEKLENYIRILRWGLTITPFKIPSFRQSQPCKHVNREEKPISFYPPPITRPSFGFIVRLVAVARKDTAAIPREQKPEWHQWLQSVVHKFSIMKEFCHLCFYF